MGDGTAVSEKGSGFGAEPKVRIHLPPAASQQRTVRLSAISVRRCAAIRHGAARVRRRNHGSFVERLPDTSDLRTERSGQSLEFCVSIGLLGPRFPQVAHSMLASDVMLLPYSARRAAIISASPTVSPDQKVGGAPDVEVGGRAGGSLAVVRADRGARPFLNPRCPKPQPADLGVGGHAALSFATAAVDPVRYDRRSRR
jgi:hypothetical protein